MYKLELQEVWSNLRCKAVCFIITMLNEPDEMKVVERILSTYMYLSFIINKISISDTRHGSIVFLVIVYPYNCLDKAENILASQVIFKVCMLYIYIHHITEH